MKKRLLSAALALAMVLTMLPLSAMPAFASADYTSVDAGTTVKLATSDIVVKEGNTNVTKVSAGEWYATKTEQDNNGKNVTRYCTTNTGVVCGTTSGKWYADADAALSNGSVSQLTVIGSGITVDLTKAKGTSLKIDVRGQDVTINANSLNNTLAADAGKTTLTSVTVTNSVKDGNGAYSAELSGSIKAVNQSFGFTAERTAGTGPSIELDNSSGTSGKLLTVKLTDAKVGTLTTKLAGLTLTATANTVNAAETGAITVNQTKPVDDLAFDPGNTTINVTGGKTGAITVNGEGSITLNGKATVDGAITLNTGKKYVSGSNTMPKWGGNFRVDINSQCTVNSIAEATGGCDGIITVNANTGSTVTNGIDLSKSATAHVVKVDGGKVGPVSMNAGTLTIQNSASVGKVELGTSTEGGKLTANISGGTIAGLDATAGSKIDPTVNISGGTFTEEVKLPDKYNKRTITGGTFSATMAEKSGWLNNVSYEIERTSGGKKSYTYTNSFQDCVNAYKIGKDTVAVRMVGSASSPSYKATFNMGAQNETVVVITSDDKIPVILPSAVNGKSVGTWYVGSNQEPKDAGSPILLTGDTTISASETASDDSQLASVEVNYGKNHKNNRNPGLSAVLSGTTIKLSGALNSETVPGEAIELKFKTVLGTEYLATVAFYPELNNKTKQVLFVSSESGSPIQAGRSSDTLMLKGNTTVYTLDGSGLVVSATVEGPSAPGKTTASVSGVSLGTAEKAALEALLTNESTGLKPDNTLVTSPAIQEAVNKIVAGLSQSQVDSYIRQGRIAQWKQENNTTRNPNDSELNDMSDWKTLAVDVYLNVQVTAWNRQSVAQSMTLNITPFYSLVLKTDGGESRVVKTGVALPMTGVTADYGSIKVTLPENLLGEHFMDWAHHGDYVYKIDETSHYFETTHGFSPFVINGTAPNAMRAKDQNGSNVLGYYDNVQTAIDETGYGTDDKEYVILRNDYSKTAETYSISGKARTFTFVPGNNGTFVPTFSGANTTADKTNGNVWTVQLNADSVVNNASISVKTASNGSATINLTSAKPGASVSGTYTANSGYKAGAFTATAQPGNKSVTVNVAANGTFSFTVPADATSVTVTPSFVLDTGLPFTDVPASAWYFDGVKYCYNTTKNGYRVMEGFSSTQFGADRAYTRAEVVTILWNLKGRPTPGAATRAYTDVNSGHWAYNAIVWATNNGYAEGYPNGSFQPSSSVTREEMVVFLWRAAGKPTTYNSINLNGFADGYNVHDWGLSAMKWAVALNILSGQNSVSLNGTLAARTTAYRREVAVTVMNFDKLNLF